MNRQEPGSVPTTRKERIRPVAGDGDNGSARYEDESARYEGRSARYEGESVPGLVKKLALDLTTLFSQEVELAKAEMTSAVRDVRSGISSMAMGGGVLYAGILFLLGGVMMLLTQWVSLTVAAFIVGGVVTIIGAIMLAAGKKKMSAERLTPDRTIDSVRKDAEYARRKAT